MSRILLIIVIALVGIFLWRFRKQPDIYVTKRARKIDATPSQLKSLLADFSKDTEWNPFMQGDPALQVQIGDKPSGVGAKLAWQGKRSGAGNSEILEADNHHVKRSLIMLKPMRADNIVDFTFDIDGDQTLLTWTMSGQMTTAQKAFQSVFNSEKMIGGAFEKGLDQIETYFKN